MLTLLRTVKFQHIILTTAWVHGVIMPLRSGGAQSTHNLYDVKPLKIGVEVFGVDLQKDVTDDIKAQIKADVTKHKIVVFRDQGIVSGDRHVELSEWFGPCESTFYKHSKSPHPDVFRVSNDDDEGCRGVGRTGWHVDGSFQPAPFSYALYHIWSVPKDGDTVFVDLNALILSLSTEQRQRWERLSMVADRRMNRIHPLLYTHPITGDRTMCFHLGMTEAFVWDEGTQNERLTSPSETRKLLQEIHNEIVKNNRELIMEHKWQSGDFIMSDNLAVGHEAHPSTQLSPDVVGLRIMHRTTVKGIRPPAKFYKDGPQPKDEL